MLEEKRRALDRLRRDLVHRRGIIQPAIEHGVAHLFAVAQIFQRIAIDQHQVSQLAGLDRPDLGIHAEIAGTVDGGTAQRLERAEPALLHHPELPVRAKTRELTVRADHDRYAEPVELECFFGHEHMVIVRVGRGRAPDRARHDHRLGCKGHQMLVLPDIGPVVPVLLAHQSAVGDDEGRRVENLGLAPELVDVAVNVLDRKAVFDAGMTVDDLGQILLQPHAAFGHHEHAQFACCLEHLLALVAPQVVVTLDRDRTLFLLAPDVEQRVVVAIDRGGRSGSQGTVENPACGKQARRQRGSGALQFDHREHAPIVVRGVVDGGDTKRQIRILHPVLARLQLLVAHCAVGVGIDQAWDQRHARSLDDAVAIGHRNRIAGTDRLDPVAAHQHGASLDDFLARSGIAHRHDTGTDQRDSPIRSIRIDLEGQVTAVGFRLGQLLRRTIEEGEGPVQRTRVKPAAIGPAEGPAVCRPVQVFTTAGRNFGDREGRACAADGNRLAGREKRCDIGVVMLCKCNPATIGRDLVAGDPVADQVLSRLVTVEVDAVQRPLGVIDPLGKQDALAIGRELRLDTAIQHSVQVPAISSDPIQPGLLRPGR